MFLTARDAIADRVKGLDSGANDYLVKPFSFEELSARLRAMIPQPLWNDQQHAVSSGSDTGLRLSHSPARRQRKSSYQPKNMPCWNI